MLARELAELLRANPDVEVTVNVWDGDWSEEEEVDTVIDWESFVSIQHSTRR
jgi:hypothetical protein